MDLSQNWEPIKMPWTCFTCAAKTEWIVEPFILRYTYRCKATRIFSILDRDPQKTHGLLTARSTGPLEIQKRKFLLNPSNSTWGLVALITYTRNIPATHPTQSLQTIRFLLLVVMIPNTNLSRHSPVSEFPLGFLCVDFGVPEFHRDRKKIWGKVYSNLNLKWWASLVGLIFFVTLKTRFKIFGGWGDGQVSRSA